MIKVPDRILNLKPYVAGKTIDEVKQQYNVTQISKLASNENRLGCSPEVPAAVSEALQQIQDYPDPVARILKKEIADRNTVSEGEVLVAAGSESILSILCRTFADEGEQNIVTADATFVGIFVQAGVMGIGLKKVPVTKDFGYDTRAIISAIDENTRMVYIANPNNPTGTFIEEKAYREFIDAVPDDVLIIADEAYYEYARNKPGYPSALDYRRNNVIITRTFSKGYGLAGFRIGYAIADTVIIEQLMKCKLTFEPTTPAQAAALAAIRDDTFLEKSVQLVENQRKRLCDFFNEQEAVYVPSISNSVMLVLKNEDEAINFSQQMLENGVILRQLNAFGLPHCVRITIGTQSEMDHFMKIYSEIRS
ncbi:histidinol-phosphate transaminase [Rhodohalobacter sp. SW132]|uniref:histidinol-phosphate transaminase n=1 Tax=Rhodohalobacter sp. SW132 TaxID=2293433 RepID=UPI000E25B044|nr:histidinol-phosphate transaminase [Rhodohalobacter sp. SW132]REL33519.1 histidinol-phosphate transaminase [Rhodohalobacter sp. SW132]